MSDDSDDDDFVPEEEYVPEEEIETTKKKSSTRRKRKLNESFDEDTPPAKRKKEEPVKPKSSQSSVDSKPSQGSNGSKKRRQLELSDSEDDDNDTPVNDSKATSWTELALSSSEDTPKKEEPKPRRSLRSAKKKEEKIEEPKKQTRPKRTRKSKTAETKNVPDKKEKKAPAKKKKAPAKKRAPAKKKAAPKPKSPPKGKKKAAKKKKVVAVKGDAASQKVLAFIQKENRPFSYVGVFDSLKKTVGKTDVKKILAKLAAAEEIGMVDIKGKLTYFALQPDDGEFTPELLVEMSETIEKTRTESKEKLKLLSSLKAENGKLRQYPSDDEIAKLLSEAEEKLNEKEQKLEEFRNGNNVSAEDMTKIQNDFQKLFRTWKKRRKAVKDMGDTFVGETAKKPKKLLQEMGVETDAEVDVDVKDWEDVIPKKKFGRKRASMPSFGKKKRTKSKVGDCW